MWQQSQSGFFILLLLNFGFSIFSIFSNFLLARVVKNTLFTFFIRMFGNFGFWPTYKRNFGYRSGRTVNFLIMFWQLPRTYCLNMAALQSFFPFECGNLGVSFFQKYSLYSLSP